MPKCRLWVVCLLQLGAQGLAPNKFFHSTSMPVFPHSDVPLATNPVDRSIMVFDDVLSAQDCARLIHDFKLDTASHYDGAVMVRGVVTLDAALKKNTELHVTELAGEGSARWSTADSLLSAMVQRHLALYQDANIILSTQQNPFSSEGFRLKRYVNDSEEHHAYHADCGHETSEKPHRILAVLLYLNTVLVGGETVFLNQGVSISPVVGRLAIFPTAFSYIHAGKRPISGSKFVVINFLTT